VTTDDNAGNDPAGFDDDEVQVRYDLSGWTFDQQAELAAVMADAEIPHGWDGMELVVPDHAEQQADAAIADVELRLGIDTDGADEVADSPIPIELDVEAASVEYDLGDWNDHEHELITTALVVDGVPFRWDASKLFVAADREAHVDELLDMVERGDLQFESDDQGERLPFETLSTFFLAADRLKRNPRHSEGLAELVKAFEVADPARPPYGVDARLWTRTCELAEELVGAIVDHDEPDEPAVTEVATELHDLLRPYV
jgi:hypothetical protein